MGARASYSTGTFCWADLSTSDLDAAKGFYTGVFGWELDEMPVGAGQVYVMCRKEGADVAALSRTDQHPAWMSYVAADDADAVAARARALGANLLAEPFDVLDSGRMAVIADPAGAIFGLWQAGRHHGAGRVNEAGALTWNDLQTTDVDGAREFYGQLFPWRIEETPGAGGQYWTIHGPEGNNGGMMRQRAEGVPPQWVPYFGVEELDGALAKVEELGGRSLAGPMHVPAGGFAVVQDPQGAVFSLFGGTFDE